MKNFKSFGGEHEISEIDRHMTIIVGPNGSGKSNIIDAILFVLGFRAKKLRQTSLVNLIHKGTQNENMCYVELVFSKLNTSYTIRRELYSNKKSRYFFNSKEKNFSEIQDFMLKEGIDIESNRFLILQGEIESISMMKPKSSGEKAELLEYLEDIIGTRHYNEDIDVKKAEVGKIKNLYDSKNSELKFYEKEFKYVQSIKDQNEELIKESIKLMDAKKTLNLLKKEKLLREKESILSEKKDLEVKLQEFFNRKKININSSRSIEEEICRQKKNLSADEKNLNILKERFKNIDLDQKKYLREKEKYERSIGMIQQEITESKRKETTKFKERSVCEAEITQNDIEIKNLESKIAEINKYLEHVEIKNSPKVSKIKKKKEALEEKLKYMFNAREELRLKEAKIDITSKDWAEKKHELEREMSVLSEELNKLDDLISTENYSNRILELDSNIKKIENDIDLTWKQLNKRKFLYKEIEKNEEKYHDYKKVDDLIKNIKGVHGRLRNLGLADEKYERAISAASKGSLNSVVVDCTETAEKCANIIRKHNMCRTTFIIIDRISDIPRLNKESMPYAFELVKTEKIYRKCFYYALKDTLVTEDIGKAKEIAFGKCRKRIVTLDGKLIEKSGLMSSTSRSMIGLNKAQKYRDEISKLEEVLREMYKNKKENYAKKEELVSMISLIKNKTQRKLEISRSIEIRKKNILELGLNENQNDELINIKANLNTLENDINNLKKMIKSYENSIEEVYGDEYKQISTQKEQAENRLNTLGAVNQNLKIRLNELKNEDLSHRGIELAELVSKLQNLKPATDYEKYKKKFSIAETSYKEKLGLLKNLNDDFNEVKTQLEQDYLSELKLKNRTEDIEDCLRKLKNNIEKAEKNIHDVSQRIKKLCTYVDNNYSYQFLCKQLSDKEINQMILKNENILKAGITENVNTEIFEDYRKKYNDYEASKKECKHILNELNEINNELNFLVDKRHKIFMEGFHAISKNLKEVYQIITFGGNAELELVDCLDPFTEGIILSVMPPKKTWKNINNLSGGEKTLASLGLVFALNMYKPSPFYVMDEIDAALDFRNVSVVANFIKERTKDVQFIIVSLRNDMFELSDTLLGVYKNYNSSKFIVVNTKQLMA